MRLALVGLGEFAGFLFSSEAFSWTSEEKAIDWRAGLDGVMSLTVPEKGSG